MDMELCHKFSRDIALAAVKIEAIKLQPDNPFTWASGYRMPIYNDNRQFFYYPEYRELIVKAFHFIVDINDFNCDVVAGIPVSGIPWAVLLAEKLGKPFIYNRKKMKAHGRQKMIEGIQKDEDLIGKRVLVVEDLVSTGKSSLESINILREAGAEVKHCLSIFSYGLPKAAEAFKAANCESISTLEFSDLITILRHEKYFNDEQLNLLSTWNSAPMEWGEKNGFPPKK